MLACFGRCDGDRAVRITRSANIDQVDAVVGDKVLPLRVGLLPTESASELLDIRTIKPTDRFHHGLGIHVKKLGYFQVGIRVGFAHELVAYEADINFLSHNGKSVRGKDRKTKDGGPGRPAVAKSVSLTDSGVGREMLASLFVSFCLRFYAVIHASTDRKNMTSSAADRPDRLLSLDVMRGLTIIAMILVNNPGSWGALYWPLGHAAWHGWTPTDLIFPFFLFMVGVAMAYSFAKYVDGEGKPTRAVWIRLFRRVTTLILLGLLLNGSRQIFNYLLGNAASIDFDTLRWPGVLQRIALAYLGGAIVVLLFSRKGQIAAGLVLLVGYWAMLVLLPTATAPDERLLTESNIVRSVDVALIGKPHMWGGATSHPTDPEGLLSTLPAIVTVLFGYWSGRLLRRESNSTRRLTHLLFGAIVLTGLGLAIPHAPWPWLAMPINKALWTPTFVLLAAGLGMAMLAACLLIFDVWGKKSSTVGRIATAFQMVGVNAIFVFVASGLVASLLTVLKIGDQTVKGWIYENLFVGPLSVVGDPRFTSLAYAVAFIACWWLVLWAMWRRGWSIRV